MGDPKKSRQLFARPPHPWKADRIRLENELQKKFGLKNKREIWKAAHKLKIYRKQARDLLALTNPAPHRQRQQTNLMSHLHRYGMIESTQTDPSAVLSLTTESILARRLQSQVYFRGLASTLKQARQLITHGHISVDGRRLTVPSYLVSIKEEELISYNPSSPLVNELHPMRPSAQGLAPERPDEVVAVPTEGGEADG